MTSEGGEGALVGHESCPKCNFRDNLPATRPPDALATRVRWAICTSLLTSGPFLLQRDAAGRGQQVASDPVVLLDFLSRI